MTRLVTKFLKDTQAAIALEAVIITPILAWLFVGSFVFFDAFRSYNSSVKASYAIADAISRYGDDQDDVLYESDIEGLADVFDHITRGVEGSEIRVTEVWRRQSGYEVEWSEGTGTMRDLNTNDIPAMQQYLPPMVVGEAIIYVETFLPYRPAFNVGLSELEFTNNAVTRPRFAGFIRYEDGLIHPDCGPQCGLGEGDGPESEDDPDATPGA